MTTQTTGFSQGDGIGIVAPAAWLLLERAPGEIVNELIGQVGSGIDGVLEVLAGVGLRNVGSFAIAVAEDTSVRIVVRGTARALVVADGNVDIDGAELKTWNEQVVPDWTKIHLSLDDEVVRPPARFELERGVVPAGALVHPNERPSARRPEPVDPQPPIASVAPEPYAPTQTISSVPIDPEESAPEAQIETPTPEVLESSATDPDAESGAPVANDLSEDPQPAAASGDPVSGYDEMYGQTMHRGVQDAAIHDDSTERSADADMPPSSPPALHSPASDAPLPELALGDHDGNTISLAELRAMQEAEAAAAPAPPVESPTGDHDGLTIAQAQFRAMAPEPAPPTPPSPSSAVTVQARVCSSGHPNPTHLAACRSCGAELAGDPVTVARPRLGRLTLSTGELVVLDRPVLLGRNPKIEGRLVGELPRIVRLEHFHGVSRTHAMVRLEGWQVLVVDLGSANHTTVTLPGRPPRRLRSDEPILLVDGASIDLGGEVTATYGADS